MMTAPYDRTAPPPDLVAKMVTWAVLTVLVLNVDMGFQARVIIDSLAATGEGSALRQGVYLGAVLISLVTVVWLRSPAALADLIPISLVMLFGWAAISLSWSLVPGIGARRLFLTILTAITVLSMTALQPPMQVLTAFRQVVVALALASLALALVAPQLAIHQPGDAEPLIVGDWRGVFYHKNIFGAALAPAAVILFHEMVTRRSPRHGGPSLALLLALLWQSGSKTALALALVMMGLLWLLEIAGRSPGWRLILGAGAYFLGLFAALVFGLWALHSPVETLLDPTSFTGRGYIWQSLLAMAEGKTLFGYGYQSVFQIGVASPLAQAFSERFFVTLPHAHSAYVEMVLQIGWIGLGLFVTAVIVVPLWVFTGTSRAEAGAARLALALMLLTWLHGVLEAGLFDRDRTMWVVFLLAYGVLRQLPQIRRGRHGA